MATTDIVSPDGLDLNPEPPGTMRVSKRAGIVFLAVGAIVAGMILYGILTRGARPAAIGLSLDDSKRVTAATDTGKVIAAQVPVRPSAESRELVAPVAERPEVVASTRVQRASYSPAPVYVPPPAPAYRELTAEERRRELASARELEAINAPTSARGGFGGGPTQTPAQADVSQLAQLARGLQAGSADGGAAAVPRVVVGGVAGVSQAEEYRLQNAQDEKSAWLARRRAGDRYLAASRVEPLGEYEIKAGWDIPAILEQAINSD